MIYGTTSRKKFQSTMVMNANSSPHLILSDSAKECLSKIESLEECNMLNDDMVKKEFYVKG